MGPKHEVLGVNARNTQQNIALNLLMDPQMDFVTLLGRAGSGKTLLALASGLEQIFGMARYQQIIMTRATVPIGEDIGYLPGTEEEKMGPWMGAFNDNLDFLLSGIKAKEGRFKIGMEEIMDKVRIKSLSFMRGRTFADRFVIIDEAQNLTPKQMKALVTRAGNGTKVVCLGNIAQIDTPYLTEGNSGITYAIERFKGWKHYGHVTLPLVVRSRLAEHASAVMNG
jgi:PhoH-like ATPase